MTRLDIIRDALALLPDARADQRLMASVLEMLDVDHASAQPPSWWVGPAIPSRGGRRHITLFMLKCMARDCERWFASYPRPRSFTVTRRRFYETVRLPDIG